MSVRGIKPQSPKPPIFNYLIAFFEYTFKSIPLQAYKVFESDQIQQVIFANFPLLAEYQHIKFDFESGRNLNKYLSTTSTLPYADRLLYDWRIHHLHLSISPGTKRNLKKGGFVERSSHQLFFKVRKDEVFFIKIVAHLKDDFEYSDQDFLEIVLKNWPNLLEPYRLRTAYGLSEEISQLDRAELRKVDLTPPVQLSDGRLYMGAGMGLSSAGTSVLSTRKADHILSGISEIERYIATNSIDTSNLYLDKQSDQLLVRNRAGTVQLTFKDTYLC